MPSDECLMPDVQSCQIAGELIELKRQFRVIRQHVFEPEYCCRLRHQIEKERNELSNSKPKFFFLRTGLLLRGTFGNLQELVSSMPSPLNTGLSLSQFWGQLTRGASLCFSWFASECVTCCSPDTAPTTETNGTASACRLPFFFHRKPSSAVVLFAVQWKPSWPLPWIASLSECTQKALVSFPIWAILAPFELVLWHFSLLITFVSHRPR